jgi:uncharacterized NAD-dependent epimerase/dehydratase family protein
MHGVMPDAMVLVHHPARRRDDYDLDIDDLPRSIALHESILRPFKASKVAAVAMNPVMMTATQAAEARKDLERRTGLPVADVLTRDGRALLADALLDHLSGRR